MNAQAAKAKIPTSQETNQPSPKLGPTEEEIRQRAYEIYLSRNGASGNEVEDWLQAEREINLDRG